MNRYSDMTIWQLREELAAIKGELTTRDVTPREPNAAASGEIAHAMSMTDDGPAPAAPDVASMVKRLRELADETERGIGWTRASGLMREAAALLAKLGQGS